MTFIDLSVSSSIADCGVLIYQGSCFLLGIGSRFHSIPFRIRSNDENVVTRKATWDETYSDPILVPTGLVTRARAKKFKDALMGLI